MKLVGAVTEGSGAINEDGWSYLGTEDDVRAAWIFDGVTGINGRNYLPGESDAAWLVGSAQEHLETLAGRDLDLREIVDHLVRALIGDWADITRGVNLPEDYDPPAACLILAKQYGGNWRAVRLGDSCLLARDGDGQHRILAASPNNSFDHWLANEARKRRDAGVLDVKALLAEFRPQLLKGRALRNRPGGYGILEADLAAVDHAEYLELGQPGELLLCTDGFYRAVDLYGLYGDESLIKASIGKNGVNDVLAEIRAVEASDPACQKYIRFKPADDATALMLRR